MSAAAELAAVTALLARRTKPVKFDKPHIPGYQGHVMGGEAIGLTASVATINLEKASSTLSTTGSLKGTHGLFCETRPTGEQDFHAEESELWAYDFGRRNMAVTGDYRSM
eukprot:CAMPEP_0117649214 /NCGR_PEP_ID=MMETSP0804-20121206/846_1 /TAXON_ID=1074897 /ORGANISM="Tetraselmis astigmatica, Strain CCMP880" /LENGTH=109 /DNA_ID=CAMNT_0005454923 /DNA_START=1 /DNA_END=330 /DNA_ORIENTATION=+